MQSGTCYFKTQKCSSSEIQVFQIDKQPAINCFLASELDFFFFFIQRKYRYFFLHSLDKRGG